MVLLLLLLSMRYFNVIFTKNYCNLKNKCYCTMYTYIFIYFFNDFSFNGDTMQYYLSCIITRINLTVCMVNINRTKFISKICLIFKVLIRNIHNKLFTVTHILLYVNLIDYHMRLYIHINYNKLLIYYVF